MVITEKAIVYIYIYIYIYESVNKTRRQYVKIFFRNAVFVFSPEYLIHIDR